MKSVSDFEVATCKLLTAVYVKHSQSVSKYCKTTFSYSYSMPSLSNF